MFNLNKEPIMVKLKFIIRNGVLALRISEGKERYYKRMASLMKGQPDLKHWKQEKEMFSGYAEFYKENNQILSDFKDIYWRLIKQHPELNAKQVAAFYKPEQPAHQGSKPVEFATWDSEDYCNSVSKFLEVVIVRERAKQGCNFESYHKLLSRCRRDIVGFDKLTFSAIDYNKMVEIAHTFAREPGYRGISKTFRALLGRASREQDVDFRLTQIGGFQFGDYNPKKHEVSVKHPDILTTDQVKEFLNTDPYYLTPEYKNRESIELFYDFCVFMLHSFFAPCDAIKVKTKNVTKRGTIIARRKKTNRQVEVPITPAMQRIIDKYRGRSKDGYIFPIMDDEKERGYKTKDLTYKKFRGKLNIWLKHVGKTLGVDYDLYAYVFRHTAITIAVDSGLPVYYVSATAGTDIEMIQKHYYNGDNVRNREMLKDAFMGMWN